MRIIGGRLGGRRLTSFKADHIRPTTDRVKESLFNIIGQNLEGQRVLDLFSGTGNLAIESFSRGAVFVEAVEKHPKSLAIIRKNLDELELSKSIRVIKSDVFAYLKKYRGEAYDLVLVDPPFTESLADSVMEEISRSGVWQMGTLIVIESSAKEKIGDAYLELVCIDRRDFGDKILSIFQPKVK
jgi:16S rRNA (guanine966-N2)-methyltransferase